MSEDSSDSAKKSTASFGIRWWQALIVTVVVYVVSLFLGSLVGGLVRETTVTLSIAYLISSLSMIGCTYAFLTYKKVSIRSFLGPPSVPFIVLVPLFYIIYVFLSRLVQSVLDIFSPIDIEQVQDFGFQTVAGPGLLAVFVALVILPPLAEEILFRGVLYRSFRSTFGRVASALFVSLAFGFAHWQWNVAADTFVLSMVLVFLTEKSRSLWPAIALHFLKNLVAYVLVFVFKLS